jgi:sulfoxide reductase heme-binding subunit YedZ
MSGLTTSTPVWYLMRSSGIVALLLLTVVVALGVATANRWRPGRVPRFVTLALHRSTSLLAVAFLALHVVTAVIDPDAAVRLTAVFVPFASARHPLWLGLGALSLDLVLALIVTSLLRHRLSLRLWKGIHWLAYAAWPLALAHGLGMGTDAAQAWFLAINLTCVAIVALAAIWRLLSAPVEPKHRVDSKSPRRLEVSR